MKQKWIKIVFYLSISKMTYFGWINSSKEKFFNPRPVLLIFLSCLERTELMDALKCWAKSILFLFAIWQQVFQVDKFRIWEKYVYAIHNYLLATNQLYIQYISNFLTYFFSAIISSLLPSPSPILTDRFTFQNFVILKTFL